MRNAIWKSEKVKIYSKDPLLISTLNFSLPWGDKKNIWDWYSALYDHLSIKGSRVRTPAGPPNMRGLQQCKLLFFICLRNIPPKHPFLIALEHLWYVEIAGERSSPLVEALRLTHYAGQFSWTLPAWSTEKKKPDRLRTPFAPASTRALYCTDI